MARMPVLVTAPLATPPRVGLLVSARRPSVQGDRWQTGGIAYLPEVCSSPAVNEVQSVTLVGPPTGGTFTLTHGGQATGAIAFDATAATVRAALEGLDHLAPGDVTVTGAAGGPYTITFGGDFAATDTGPITADGTNLTGPGGDVVTVAQVTQGRSGGTTGIGIVCSGAPWTPLAAPRGAVEWSPNLIHAEDDCTEMGGNDRDRAGRARRILAACESATIASELWTGAASATEADPGDRNLALADDSATDVGGSGVAAVGLLTGIIALDLFIADSTCGQRGMIHVTRDVAILLHKHGVLLDPGTPMQRTANDNLVIADAGYPGTGPSGEPRTTSTSWAYSSSLVDVVLSEVKVRGDKPEELHRAVNDRIVTAERVVVAGWDGCAHGRVNLDVAAA